MKEAIAGILSAIGLFVLQELGSYLLNKIFDGTGKRVPSILRIIKEKRIKKFYQVKNSEEYKEFEYQYLKNYYGDKFFTTINNKSIPIFSIKYANECKNITGIRDYDELGDKTDVDFSFEPEKHQNYKKEKYYKEYHYLVGDKIKYPDRPGVMLDEIICDNEGKMTNFRGFIGTYAENVYTNHVLEYELYRLFCKERKKDFSVQQKKSVIRNAMHKSVSCPQNDERYINLMRHSLCKGEGRKSLLSVQMLVLIRNGNDYNIKIIQRSKDVAVAPERFQLVPSGGFEILNDSISGYSRYEVEDNYSAGCAIFREYLEEIFGIEEFEGKGVGSVNELLIKDERIKEIESMLRDKTAEFQFLGSVIDLAGLRHELSFVLVIHDEKYNSNKFLGNEECKNRTFISNVTLLNFEEREDIWEDLHGPSATMWKLFKESDIYRDLVNESVCV